MINTKMKGFQTVHMNAGAKDGTLRERRVVLELTQRQVAERAKISLNAYQKFESGERNIRTASFNIACRVLLALEMDPTAFFKGDFIFGEPIICDVDGWKYVRTGRLMNDDIDDDEAINVMRIHIRENSIVIPLKILRAMDSPDMVQIMYRKADKQIGIKTVKAAEENTIIIPQEAYSGRWRGIKIEDERLVSLIYEMIGRGRGNYVGEPQLFEKGCILALDSMVPSNYKIDGEKYYLLSLGEK